MAPLLPIEDRARGWLDKERPDGVLLEGKQVTALAVAAAVFYRGFAHLDEHWERLAKNKTALPLDEIDSDTPVSDSEWALIRPLFLLYIERETALMLEASRGLGVDVFGRTASEIAADITAIEQEMAHRAFYQPIVTVI